MRQLRKLFSIVAGFLIISNAIAQKITFDGIKKFYGSGINTIAENNEVKGYYIFSIVDKASKGMNIYKLTILDNNLMETHSIEMKKSDKLALIQSAFNGERFCFIFIDYGAKSLEYALYDKEGKATGAYKVTGLSNSEIQASQSADNENYLHTDGLASIPGKGFVRYGIEKQKGTHLSLEMFDNNGKKVWEADAGTDPKSKSYESAIPYYADDKVMASLITTRPRLMSTKDMESNVVFQDVNTGKELFKIPTTTKNYGLMPQGVSYDETTEEYFVYGEYTKPKDIVSLGFYIGVYDKNGTANKEGYFSWTGDIFTKMPAKAKAKMEKNMLVAVHKMIRLPDGNFIAVGEQYRKAVSGSAIGMAILAGALNAAGGGAVTARSNEAFMKVELYNIMLYRFNKDLKLEKVDVVEKTKTNVALPRGIGINGGTTLGYYLKAMDEFDYAFTTVSPDRTKFNIDYTNYDRDKEDGNKMIVGVISYDESKEVKTDKVDFTTSATRNWVIPAKPGYVCIYEYFRKQKKVEMRLEKTNN